MTDFPDEMPLPEYDSEPDDVNDALETESDDEPIRAGRYRGGGADPAFGFLLAIAVSIGLTPILPESADMRYTLAWGALAGVGVLSWLLGSADRVGQETPDNIGWGAGFGLIVSIPFAIFSLGIFGQAARLMFANLQFGTVLAYLIFVMPLAETLFFRGLLQRRLEFWIVGLLGGLWSVVLFFPVMWADLTDNPAVGVYLATALFILNLMYSYVRQRNGLAAAWICQIVASLILFFLPLVV